MDYSPSVRLRLAGPKGAGDLGPGTPGRIGGEAGSRPLNAWVRFDMQLLDGRVQRARFRAYGCPHLIAAASWAAEHFEGRGAVELRAPVAQVIAAELAVPVEKLGKLLLVEDALRACADELEHHAGESTHGSVVDAKRS
jgi:NifU-like protein involved in Fe-S cluster formation